MHTECGAPLDATHVECPAQNSPPSPPKSHSRAAPASQEGNVLETDDAHVSGRGCRCASIAPAFVGVNPAPDKPWHAPEIFCVVGDAAQPLPVVRTACKFVQDGGVPGMHEHEHCALPPSTTTNES
jgi:hypothetical protein